MLMTPFVPDGPQEGAKWQGLARLVASGATHHEPRGRPGGGKGHSPGPEIRVSSLDNLFRSVTYLTLEV